MSEEKLHECFIKQGHGQERSTRKYKFIKDKLAHRIVSSAEICFRKKTQEGFNTVNMSGLDTFRDNSVSVSSENYFPFLIYLHILHSSTVWNSKTSTVDSE